MIKKKTSENELKGILPSETTIEEKTVPIIIDKHQYSIKIPMKFAKTLNIKKNDGFKFILEIPVNNEKEITLKGVLIKNAIPTKK